MTNLLHRNDSSVTVHNKLSKNPYRQPQRTSQLLCEERVFRLG